jgi:ubiquinone/menaquinone biosynthesis C-methylase UbiE
MYCKDQKSLVTNQYRCADHLNARIELHQRFSTHRGDWFRWVFDHFGFPPQARLLELGCGPGLLWQRNLDRLPPGWQVILSDLSNGMLQSAVAALQGHPQLIFRVLDAQLLPFEEGSLDGVIANHMLYHVPNLERALQEIWRVLRPGGRLIAATNGLDHLQEIFQLAAGYAPLAQALDPQYQAAGRQGLTFSLENGEPLLAGRFSTVRRRLYPDSLAVTQAQPLVDYILSWIGDEREKWTPQALKDFVEYIQAQIDRSQGSLMITKSSGLFEAVK